MIKELIEKRQRLHEENAEILAKASKEGRDVLTADEEQEWKCCMSEGRARKPTLPILASSDPRRIRVVMDAIVRRVTPPSSAVVPLRPVYGRRAPIHGDDES